jgi:membrane protein
MLLMATFWRPMGSRRSGRGSAPVSVEVIRAREPGRSRGAQGPLQVPPRGWLDAVWRVGREINDDRLPAVAGGVTFYILLSIFPGLGVFVSLYGLFADVALAQEQFVSLIGIFPDAVLTIIGEQMIRLVEAPPRDLSLAFVVSLLLAIFSASAGASALLDGLNIAYDEDEKRSFLQLRLLALGATAGLLVTIMVLTGLLVALPALLPAAGVLFRWIAALAFTTGLFSILYRYGPCRAHPKWLWVTWGSFIAAVLWMLGSLGFSVYVTHFANLDRTYGPLGAVIAFMIWIWFSVLVLLVGAEVNAEIEHQTAVDSTTGPEKPMGEHGAVMVDTLGLSARVGQAVRAFTERLQQIARPDRKSGGPPAPE